MSPLQICVINVNILYLNTLALDALMVSLIFSTADINVTATFSIWNLTSKLKNISNIKELTLMSVVRFCL